MSHVPPPYPAPAPWGAPAPQPPKRHGRALLTHGITAILALSLGAGLGAGSSESTEGRTPPTRAADRTQAATPAADAKASSSPTATSKPTPTRKPGPPTSVEGDGVYLVGTDMKPGTYLTEGPDPDAFIENCYWARRSDASGEFEAIIANGNAQGQTRVALRKGEYFETTGCSTWRRVG